MNNINDIIEFLKKKPGYKKWGNKKLSTFFDVSIETVKNAKKAIKLNYKNGVPVYEGKGIIAACSPERRVLVVGDIHEPFCLDGYLEFCIDIYNKYNCNTVVFIGDIIDQHYSSFHVQDPDGVTAGDELDLSIKKIANWYNAFPNATVILGNHDRIVYRKAFKGGVSQKWIKPLKEVLEVPNWTFTEEYVLDNVCYNHGEGGSARNRMKNELQSQVQGHWHQQAYIEYLSGRDKNVFGMQVGCGIDRTKFAFAYAKSFKKQIISCGVILNNGKTPILEMYNG